MVRKAVERVHERERRMVRDEYLEMPGLCLTVPQIQRLWGFDPSVCESVLAELVSTGFLRCTPGGEYVLSGTARDLATSSRRDISSTPRDML
jgi:hypothetical protein